MILTRLRKNREKYLNKAKISYDFGSEQKIEYGSAGGWMI